MQKVLHSVPTRDFSRLCYIDNLDVDWLFVKGCRVFGCDSCITGSLEEVSFIREEDDVFGQSSRVGACGLSHVATLSPTVSGRCLERPASFCGASPASGLAVPWRHWVAMSRGLARCGATLGLSRMTNNSVEIRCQRASLALGIASDGHP